MILLLAVLPSRAAGRVLVDLRLWDGSGAPAVEDERMAARRQGPRAFVACGVMTVLDAGSSWAAIAQIRAGRRRASPLRACSSWGR